MLTLWRLSAFLLVITLTSCGEKTQYEVDVQSFRDMKNENFRSPKSSPLPKDSVRSFNGLKYFKINPSYKIEAKFTPAKFSKYVSLFEKEEVKQVHVIRGTLHFKLNGASHTLLAYSSAGQALHSLFIPFIDTHKNSYPGGRYVDGKLLNDSTCLIDFNLSYNPYCVYNEKFNCALVPQSNRLTVALPAGEKYSQ